MRTNSGVPPDTRGTYAGLMPLSFFSPHQGYAVAGASTHVVDEFRDMVKALHAAGADVRRAGRAA
jgi:glycogen operon protein